MRNLFVLRIVRLCLLLRVDVFRATIVTRVPRADSARVSLPPGRAATKVSGRSDWRREEATDQSAGAGPRP